ncbi:class I SAM-dependent methyltransferase [Nesterenkonia halotolerans]|uniref:class I SAM-dependent methyltransferase n=1 Tax=Nesterenkonia halotolerans TaxID=225325 RepID=UPI003EE63A1A
MTDVNSRAAYSRRAAAYIERLGFMDATHPSDRQLVSSWASGVGEVLDAGCGPGHWTNFLVEQGVSASGVDQVPEFIGHARSAYPGVDFTLGSLDSLDLGTGSVGGVLSWYSLIHYDPETIAVPLLEFSRVLKSGGTLLLGFFEGPTVEVFDHAVAPAYRWPVGVMSAELNAAGFDVAESHIRNATDHRPHAAIVARMRNAR